jgi:hypothetical protein
MFPERQGITLKLLNMFPERQGITLKLLNMFPERRGITLKLLNMFPECRGIALPRLFCWENKVKIRFVCSRMIRIFIRFWVHETEYPTCRGCLKSTQMTQVTQIFADNK